LIHLSDGAVLGSEFGLRVAQRLRSFAFAQDDIWRPDQVVASITG